MVSPTILVVLFLIQCISKHCDGGTNCDELGTLLYEDLKCEPKFDGHKLCPIVYDCDSFELSNDTCLFQSRKIAVGENLDNNLTYSGCQVGCTCRTKGIVKKAEFVCAVLDCPEWLDGNDENTNCYRTYELASCCGTGEKCGVNKDTTGICEVDGEYYNEGERFYPRNTCLECICDRGFNGTFQVDHHCQKQKCLVQTRNSKELSENCAPYYSDSIKCCPNTWICPSKVDVVIRNNDTVASLNCKFGNVELKLGDKIETTSEIWDRKKSVICACLLPPFLTCTDS